MMIDFRMFFLYLLPFFFILNGCEKVSTLDPQEGADFLRRSGFLRVNSGFFIRRGVSSGDGDSTFDFSLFRDGQSLRLGHRNRVCIYRIPDVNNLSVVERVEPYGVAYTRHERPFVGAVYAVYTLSQSYALIQVTDVEEQFIRFNSKLSLRVDRNFK